MFRPYTLSTRELNLYLLWLLFILSNAESWIFVFVRRLLFVITISHFSFVFRFSFIDFQWVLRFGISAKLTGGLIPLFRFQCNREFFISFQLKFNSRALLRFKYTKNELKMEETAQTKLNLLKTKTNLNTERRGREIGKGRKKLTESLSNRKTKRMYCLLGKTQKCV